MTVRIIYRIFAILFFLLILNSCSKTRLLYNNADSFLLNQFDTYFDLNNTQRLNLNHSITQFLNCTGITSSITSADNIRSDEVAYGYENGDTNKRVELRITGVLSKFIPTNDIILRAENEVIGIREVIGAVIVIFAGTIDLIKFNNFIRN